MREMKFRAWDTHNKKWVHPFDKIEVADETDFYWDWLTGSSGIYQILFNDILPFVEIMQYTGLKDKNGKEIYEDDLVKNERGEIGKIVFNNGSFVSEYLPPHNWDVMEPCDGLLDRQEVIGNIYENKELLDANNPTQ